MTIQEEELESLTIMSGKTSSKKGWGGQSQSKKQLMITTSACPVKICGKKKKQMYQQREIEREREAQSQIIVKTVEAVKKARKDARTKHLLIRVSHGFVLFC